eukprot:m.33180 g.33180  ORF g.33180 m.33180 type:complete len:145 (+) comp14213_c0_seq1:507-941(+)
MEARIGIKRTFLHAQLHSENYHDCRTYRQQRFRLNQRTGEQCYMHTEKPSVDLNQSLRTMFNTRSAGSTLHGIDVIPQSIGHLQGSPQSYSSKPSYSQQHKDESACHASSGRQIHTTNVQELSFDTILSSIGIAFVPMLTAMTT